MKTKKTEHKETNWKSRAEKAAPELCYALRELLMRQDDADWSRSDFPKLEAIERLVAVIGMPPRSRSEKHKPSIRI